VDGQEATERGAACCALPIEELDYIFACMGDLPATQGERVEQNCT
jgi:hypothetical protein